MENNLFSLKFGFSGVFWVCFLVFVFGGWFVFVCLGVVVFFGFCLLGVLFGVFFGVHLESI